MAIKMIGEFVVIEPGNKPTKKTAEGAFPALALNLSNNFGVVSASNIEGLKVGDKVYYTNEARINIIIEGKECVVASREHIIGIQED